MSALSAMVEAVRRYGSLLSPTLARGYLTLPRHTPLPREVALREAIGWLCRAQDATPDGGVARSYAFAYQPYFRRRGWIPSYPETTGYIIPTVFDYARLTDDSALFERAVRMADWECDVQMPSGAVQGGVIGAPPTPAVFNTGQVIFGLVRAHQETGNARFLDAAVRAGDFLVASQDADGAWRKSLSQFATDEIASYTYNTRTAWSLCVLAAATGRAAYTDAAVRNAEYALREQRPNGWLPNNCLYDPRRPLLHTIAYSLRGIIEIGIAVGNDAYVSAAQRAADALLDRQRPDGSLLARFDDQWKPTVAYSCLTGNAQMGLVWGRLYGRTPEPKYLDGLARANAYLSRVQWHGTGNPGLDGGISGSDPLHGRYGRFEVLNWAVKFFADSLMMETALREQRSYEAHG